MITNVINIKYQLCILFVQIIYTFEILILSYGLRRRQNEYDLETIQNFLCSNIYFINRISMFYLVDSKSKIKEIIDKKHVEHDGKCGIYIPNLMRETELSIDNLNPILKELYSEKYFILRKGINGPMIFKKVK